MNDFRGFNYTHFTRRRPLTQVICKSQHDKIGSMLDAAKSRGITVLCGGSLVDRPGYYVQPTIFVDPPRSDPIWQQEIFGPVLSVRTFRTDQVRL